MAVCAVAFLEVFAVEQGVGGLFMVRLPNSKRESAEAYPHGRWEEGALIYLVLSPFLPALVAGTALARVLVHRLNDLAV